MAVQVWIGEKPEHPNERRAIVALANGLERLDGLYLILANFSVGGRTIDLVIIKQDAVFIIELKHCDGKVFGDVNGPWFVESANGIRKRLNPGRKNPYNQVVSYYYSLINFLNERRGELLSPNKAAAVDFRTCRRVVVIAPTLHPDSKVDIDWKVDLKGLDELPVYLVTERSGEINLTDQEMLVIPELLHCTRWHEVNSLIAGVMPQWDAVPADPPPPKPVPVPVAEPVPEPVVPTPTLPARAGAALHTWPGRATIALAMLSVMLLVALLVRPQAVPAPDQPAAALIVSTTEAGPAAGGLNPPDAAQTSCVQRPFQAIGRKQNGASWENVGVIGSAPALKPDVVVTLEEVDYCGAQVQITWSVQNNLPDDTITMPLANQNVLIRDAHSNAYALDEAQSKPAEISVGPGQQASGTAVLDRPISLDATTLLLTLTQQPFGEAIWLVPVLEAE